MSHQWVYNFGGDKAEGAKEMKNLLGGKGANLCEMTNIGLPVSAGFTLTTEVCTYYNENDSSYPEELKEQVAASIARTEEIMGAKYGDAENPLLVSCRSGARVSMPGMMDTILNIGLNDETVEGIIAKSGNARFGWDSYRRLVQMYGDVVMGMKPESKHEHDPFEELIDAMKEEKGAEHDTDLSADDLKELTQRFKSKIKEQTGKDFPTDPEEQLWGSITAVFDSWNSERAVFYRRENEIDSSWGTACNICTMVFGNMGQNSGTGVAFTRDPASGANVFYGEYLVDAQGEDVVAGIRRPKHISQMGEDLPGAYEELKRIRGVLENHYKEMQDIEFTIQDGKVWMLQTRSGKRTGFAAVNIAYDFVQEGVIDQSTALDPARIPPDDLNQLLQPIFDHEDKDKAIADGRAIATGINAGPGAAAGRIALHSDDAAEMAANGDRVILVRRETSPEDIKGMAASEGILTALGGASSHAAVVSRQMGRVCVVGCTDLDIDLKAGTVSAGGKTLNAGDFISVDGFTGEVIEGEIATKPSEVIQVLLEGTMNAEDSDTYQRFAAIMEWADAARTLGVRTNADQPDQCENAIAFGAEGIGLCRTEHMFFGGDRIDAMREMILAETLEAREAALAKLLPFQREDFEGIFRTMGERPVTIRLLDPPLHEFLPHTQAEQEDLAEKIGVSADAIAARVKGLHEFNPMLGHRGCRLGIVYPEITRMQARAIVEAACNVKAEGIDVHPEIMIPLVGHLTELASQEEIVRAVAAEVIGEKGADLNYMVGTMIELPRACVAADEIAEVAEFFSFGTNDLTQTTLGVSRDDYGTFISDYIDQEIITRDPFQSIDTKGVGGLMEMGVKGGRSTRPDIKLGICGEHGGDPSSIAFCQKVGLNYVSCSPFRVPIARLAAAQAALYGE